LKTRVRDTINRQCVDYLPVYKNTDSVQMHNLW